MPEVDFRATYRSNHGKGPELARIVSAAGRNGQRLVIERWLANGKRRIRFELSRAFFESKHCAWKKQGAQPQEKT